MNMQEPIMKPRSRRAEGEGLLRGDDPLVSEKTPESRFDIIYGLLKHSYMMTTAEKDLMRRYSLLPERFNRYKDFLTSMGFLRVSARDGKTEAVEPTEKGRKFLADYPELKSRLEEDSSQ